MKFAAVYPISNIRLYLVHKKQKRIAAKLKVERQICQKAKELNRHSGYKETS
jgi:hypothetical protein